MSFFLLPGPKWLPRQVETEGRSISQRLQEAQTSQSQRQNNPQEEGLKPVAPTQTPILRARGRTQGGVCQPVAWSGWGRRGGSSGEHNNTHCLPAYPPCGRTPGKPCISVYDPISPTSALQQPKALGVYSFFTDAGTGREIKWLARGHTVSDSVRIPPQLKLNPQTALLQVCVSRPENSQSQTSNLKSCWVSRKKCKSSLWENNFKPGLKEFPG